MQASPANQSIPAFEHALKELEQIVRRLESGNTGLEQAIADYTEGMRLKAYCESKLNDARMKVDTIMKQGENVSVQPFEPSSQS